MLEIENKDNRFVARRVPDAVFRNRKPQQGRTAAHRVMDEHPQPIFKEVKYPPQGGMEVYTEGQVFAKPGDVDPFVLADINAAKHETMGLLHFWGSKELIPVYILFALLPWKKKVKLSSKILYEWVRNMEAKLWQDYLEYDKYQPMIYELIKFGKRFLMRLGFTEDLSLRIAENLLVQVEFDDQYFFKLYDMFNEMATKDAMLKDPRAEITRVFKIFGSRGQNTYAKFESAVRPLLWALRLPRIKKAFITSWEEVNLDALWPDDNVLYHCLKKADYNYGGKSNEERLKVLIEVHKQAGMPIELPQVKVTQ